MPVRRQDCMEKRQYENAELNPKVNKYFKIVGVRRTDDSKWWVCD